MGTIKNSTKQKEEKKIIKIECSDKKGLVSIIAHTIYKMGGNITSLREHVDFSVQTNDLPRFFARIEYTGEVSYEKVKAILSTEIKNLIISAHATYHARYKKKIVVFVTHEHHCLGDLLLRNMYNDFNAQIQAVISNRSTLENLCKSFNMPFFYVPYKDTMSRENHETLLYEVLSHYDFKYIVLARYMRILSENFVNKYPSRIINIHHSFLPAFIGANPYNQAYNRGVKIIGATAHFITKNLDEGPIITQQVLPIDHSYDAIKMKNAGRDVEKITLSKALELVFDDRVFISGNKTIIL